MSSLIKNIPNLFTALNLFTGCVGITLVFSGDLIHAAWCIWIAALFDFLDGFLARQLKAYTAIGKEMDSLADLVSFGVLPASLIYVLLVDQADPRFAILPFLAYLLAIFSAIRLAKFNSDTDQQVSFSGLPTPASALLVSSIPFLPESYLNQATLVGLTLFLSVLMISRIRFFSLKFSSFGFAENSLRYLFLVLSLLAFVVLGVKSIPVIFAIYLVISLISRAP